MSAIFDASVVVKWFVSDQLSAAAHRARLDFGPAIAPDLVVVECANAFRRYVVAGDLEVDAARDNLSVVAEALELLDHTPLLEEAFLLACRLNHSMTDCLYAVLARRTGLPLVTADGKLSRKLAGAEGLDIRMIAQ